MSFFKSKCCAPYSAFSTALVCALRKHNAHFAAGRKQTQCCCDFGEIVHTTAHTFSCCHIDFFMHPDCVGTKGRCPETSNNATTSCFSSRCIVCIQLSDIWYSLVSIYRTRTDEHGTEYGESSHRNKCSRYMTGSAQKVTHHVYCY